MDIIRNIFFGPRLKLALVILLALGIIVFFAGSFYISYGDRRKNLEIATINNMTLESTIIKTMLALAQTKTFAEFSEFLDRDLAGEIAPVAAKTEIML